MRILIHWIQYDAGGVDTQIYEMIKSWPDPNDHFTILYNSQNKGLKRIKESLIDYDVIFHEISWNESRHKLTGLLQFIFHPIHFLILVIKSISHSRLLAKTHDVVMVQAGTYPGSLLSLAAIVASKYVGFKKRMLVIHHGAVHGNMLVKPFSGLIDRLMHKYCTDIVAVSLATRQSLITQRGFDPSVNPIRVIYNGLSLANEDQQPADLREKFKIDENKIIIGMVGRIERYKGHEDLLRALSLLSHQEREQFQVLFIGGADENEVSRLKKISDYLSITHLVKFTGYLQENSISIIKELDILAMLTKDFEGFGLTAAEAMCAKTPILATRVGAVEEFIGPKEAYLVPPENPYEISIVLRELLGFKENFQEKVECAFRRIVDFSAERMSREYKYLLSLE